MIMEALAPWPPARWKARGLLSGSCTPGTVGHQLQPINLDTVGSLQWQVAGEPYTPYRIWLHHYWLERTGHLPKEN
jgi:hypothetical protein